jgi:hypothetical protein
MSSIECMQLEGEDMVVVDRLEEDSLEVPEWVEGDFQTAKRREECKHATNAEVRITLHGTVMPKV